MKIEWNEWPFYNHENRWVKKYQSIMDPTSKVTWPQLIAEFVIFFRKRYIKGYPDVPTGKGWSQAIQKQVRDLNQQASIICAYFPHPDDEPLVVHAVKKYFRENKPLKIGKCRRIRIIKNKNREKVNISQAEKDVVLGINHELMKAIKARNICSEVIIPVTTEESKEKTFNTQEFAHGKKRGNLSYLLELEKQLNAQEAVKDEE